MQRRAVIYARISQDRTGAGLGVDRQTEDCRKLARKLGCRVVRVYSDNDISAWSRRRTRPQYQQLLADVAAGQADTVIAWHIDRLTRQPRELEDLIDLAESHGVAFATVKTSDQLNLSTASGRMIARQIGNFARYESDQKAERVARAVEQAAHAGRWLGGRRPFGFDVDRDDGLRIVEHPTEAAELRRMTDAVIAGESLGALARDLNTRRVTTTAGKQWGYTQLRQVLTRSRNAGMATYRGQVLGRMDHWPQTVSEESWRAVCALLGDPGRRTSTTNRSRYLLSGLALCGVCGQPMKSASVRQGGRPDSPYRRIYRCCTYRAIEPVDSRVREVILAYLSRPDTAAKLTPTVDRGRLDALRQEQGTLQLRLTQLAEAFAEGEISRVQLRDGTSRVTAKLTRLQDALSTNVQNPVLDRLLTAEHIAEEWDGLSLAQRRNFVDRLVNVVIQPSGRTGRAFRPELIEITPRIGDTTRPNSAGTVSHVADSLLHTTSATGPSR